MLLLVSITALHAQTDTTPKRTISPAEASYILRNGIVPGALPAVYIPPQTTEYDFATSSGRIILPLNAPTALKDLQCFNLLGCNPILKLESGKWRVPKNRRLASH